MIAIVVLEIFEFQHKNLTYGTKPDLRRLVEMLETALNGNLPARTPCVCAQCVSIYTTYI